MIRIVERSSDNLSTIAQYLADTFETGGEKISSTKASGRKIYFTPNVFMAPDTEMDANLVSIMMPFEADFTNVFHHIEEAAYNCGLTCLRADNMWEHSAVMKDIFSLIFRSHIVVCDFTTRNPNVFYEAGIAHILGKHVVPITQSDADIPFDLRHHRYLKYLNNEEGRIKLTTDLADRLRYQKNAG